MVAVLTDDTLPPVTSPEEIFTDATEVVLLLQVPPVVASLNVVVAPPQIKAVPVIGVANAVTVTGVVARQPVGNV